MSKQLESLADIRARKAALKIHAADKATEIAATINDVVAVTTAVVEQLEAQRDFYLAYKDKFPHAGPQKDNDSTVVISGDDWCNSFGFNVRTVQRWAVLVLEEGFEKKKSEILARCMKNIRLDQAANFSSDSVEWYTPERYIEAAREVMGGIDLDPASNDEANKVVRATQFFTKKDDGLRRDWFGKVFLNPPYGKKEGDSLASMFCQKAVAEYDLGNTEACIILVNSSHSQLWQAPLYDFSVCFVDHRIKFVSGDGEENQNPTFQNIFVYLGKNEAEFSKVFSDLGYVMKKM